MIITESPNKESVLMTALKETFRETRGRGGNDAIHLSDLLMPRKAFWGRTTETLPTDEEVLWWSAGRAHEDLVARLGGAIVNHPPVVGNVVGLVPGQQAVKDGISFRPDFNWGGIPTEFKSTRRNVPVPGEEPGTYSGYLEQLLGYCSLLDILHGCLIVFHVGTPALTVWDVVYTESELAGMRSDLQIKKALLKQALTRSVTVGVIPLCPDWACGKQTRYQIAPAYCQGCEKDMTRSQAREHGKTRKGKGHTITDPVYGWTYDPKCKWYRECSPWLVDPTRKQW